MRTKSSIYVFIVRLISNIFPSILGIILNNLIILKFGSDINGITSTIGQILNFLTIFEGGFTLATNIALYKPYLDKDTNRINNILSATRIIYIRVGCLITFIALIISFASPYFIKSDLDKNIIIIIFIIAITNICIEFLFNMKYSIMFAVSQKEYINSLVVLIFNIISQALSIVTILLGGNIISIKLVALIIPLLRMPFIIKLLNKNFPNINFKSKSPDFSVLHTTKDVLAQRLAGLVFGSTDMVIISIMINTMYASVYSVYNMIYSFLKSIIFSMVLAPFNAFGQLYAEGDNIKLADYYKIYQFISIISINIFITTANILVLPFVKLYTKNVIDINYIDYNFALLFSAFCVLEIISNILGLLVNSSGHFKEMKKMAIISAVINIICSLILVRPFGIKGVVFGTIIAYCVLDSFLLFQVHIKMLKKGLFDFLFIIAQNFILSIIILVYSKKINLNFNNYFDFILNGIIVSIVVTFITFSINTAINYKLVYSMLKKIKMGFKK